MFLTCRRFVSSHPWEFYPYNKKYFNSPKSKSMMNQNNNFSTRSTTNGSITEAKAPNYYSDLLPLQSSNLDILYLGLKCLFQLLITQMSKTSEIFYLVDVLLEIAAAESGSKSYAEWALAPLFRTYLKNKASFY